MTNNKSLVTDSLLRIPVAVDLVILTVLHEELHVLLIRRGIAPYKNRWALPGGFIRPNESLEQAAWKKYVEHAKEHGTEPAIENEIQEAIVKAAENLMMGRGGN